LVPSLLTCKNRDFREWRRYCLCLATLRWHGCLVTLRNRMEDGLRAEGITMAEPNLVSRSIDARQLKGMLRDGAELALIDVREQGPFSREHLLFACCVPLSRLELMIDNLVPRRSTRTVVMDGGEGVLASRAAMRLRELGYSDVAVVAGGIEGWRAAGFELFSGVNVPSKAFGEVVEQTCHTPLLTPEELKSRMDAGSPMLILDARPMEEYRRMNIPGGIDTPGAELVYRVYDLVSDPDVLIVVNCAGRTRSIIGAQSLINAGIGNPVAALKGGTMGWRLAGFELEHGQQRAARPPSAEGLVRSRAAAREIADRAGVESIDRARLSAWQAETDVRSLFLFDVRSPEEFEAGHLPGSRSAPGGQLVQATDEYVGVQNARLVLVDDTEVRALMTASWLRQLGWYEVYVLAGGLGDEPLAEGSRPNGVLGLKAAAAIDVRDLHAALAAATTAVLDLGSSVEYQSGHIPGAWWGVRARLQQALAALPPVEHLVLTSPDGTLAQLAAGDAATLRPGLDVRVLQGGTEAWLAAGLPGATGMERPTCDIDDAWYKPYEHPEADPVAMQGYLTWEVDLVPQIARDGDARFRPLTPRT
jgi:rhodanese-related sulfurtransferase